MILENYISQLLYRYQCVTIPGFGAFLTEIQSSQLNEATHSFYPPKKLVSFNGLLKNNDGLLANHISRSEKTTYESALNFINFEVENWNAKLEDFGQFSLKNIGDFYLTNEKKIVFEPAEQINYLTDSFGLNNFKSPFVQREIEQINAEIVETENQTTNEIFEQTAVVQLKEQKRYSNPYLKYAAVLLIAAGIEGKYIIELNNETVAEKNILIEKKVQEAVYNKIQAATFVLANPLNNSLDDSELKNKYHVIANSFHNIENAQSECQKLIKKGYQSTVLPLNHNGIYQVTFQSYSSFEEAKKIENKLKSEKINAWTLIEEIK